MTADESEAPAPGPSPGAEKAGASRSRDCPRVSPQGSLTTPNSPSVNSRSLALGASLSLSNISGVSVKSDLKKRRAPPPPSLPGAGPPAQDRAAEKVRGRPGPLLFPLTSTSRLLTLSCNFKGHLTLLLCIFYMMCWFGAHSSVVGQSGALHGVPSVFPVPTGPYFP